MAGITFFTAMFATPNTPQRTIFGIRLQSPTCRHLTSEAVLVSHSLNDASSSRLWLPVQREDRLQTFT